MRRLTKYLTQNGQYLSGSLLTLFLALTLTSCAGVPSGATTPTTRTTSVPPSKQFSTPNASTDPTEKTYPVDKSCEDVMSLQALYDFNPNFAYDATVPPPGGSYAKKIVSIEGISCTYLNLSSGSKIVLSVAKLDTAGLSELKVRLGAEEPKRVTSVTPSGDASFFIITDGVGTQDILTNKYWVSVSSASFTSPEDTARFLESVLAALS